MESLAKRQQHFERHGKKSGTMNELTFWEKGSEIEMLTSLRFGRHHEFMDFNRINCEEYSIRRREAKFNSNPDKYNPTHWRIICSYEEIVNRAAGMHSLISTIAEGDPETKQLVKPFPKFVFPASLWQEEVFVPGRETLDKNTGEYAAAPIHCCKTTLPFYEFIRDFGEFDRQIEALIFWYYRQDMDLYRDDTKNDGI